MILFIESNNNVILLKEVINELNNQNHNIKTHFLSYSNTKNRSNIKSGLNSFYLQDVKCDLRIETFQQLIRQIESTFPEFTLNQCILLDRVLRNFTRKKAVRILSDYALHFQEFILKNEIKFVLGEISLGCELLFYYISKLHSVEYRDPLNTYAFNELRLIFFDHSHSSKTFKKRAEIVNINDREEEIRAEISKRLLGDINAKIGSKIKIVSFEKTFKKLTFLLKNYDSFDYRYHYSLKLHNLKRYLEFKINKVLFSYSNVEYRNERYFYFPLHIQPEATPDIVSPFYNKQLFLIEQITKALPNGMILLIKEHPNKASGVSFKERLRLLKSQTVKFISPMVKSTDLIKYSRGVITIAGTAGIEARYLKKPALLFSEIYFGDFLANVTKCYDFSQLPVKLKEMAQNAEDTEFCKSDEDIIEFFHTMEANTYTGYIYDPFIDKEVLKPQNVKLIATAINIFINEAKQK
jgi:hypothetical protein